MSSRPRCAGVFEDMVAYSCLVRVVCVSSCTAGGVVSGKAIDSTNQVFFWTHSIEYLGDEDVYCGEHA